MPDLPTNPSLISDHRPRANTWTPDYVVQKYAGRSDIDSEVRSDLAELARWDDYERQTTEKREATKQALRQLIQ